MVICVKAFGVSLMFIMLSSYSHLITHMFVISLHVVHFITPFINRPSTCCFLSNQVLCLFKFYRTDCFCRYTSLTVVPSLSINYNLVTEIARVTLRSRITGEVLMIGVGQKFE